MAKRKQTALNVHLKLKILDEVDCGTKKTAIAEQFGIPISTLPTIIKNQEKIINAAASGSGNISKGLHTTKYEDVETLLQEWFNHMRVSNIPLTDPMIQSKANDIAKDMGIKDFRCFAGWLYRFQKRQSVSSVQICGEANKVDEESANSWLHEFNRVREKYASCDVFNMDESGFFYNLFPNHTPGIKGDKCHGGRAYHKRLVRAAIRAAENNSSTPNWNLLDTIKAITAAWNSVLPQHIGKCFNRACRHSNTEDVHELEDATSTDEWTVLQDVAIPGISFEEFISVGDDVTVCPVESDVSKAANKVQEGPSEESEDEENTDTIPPTHQEMLEPWTV
ncbi:tigger transposable element-derived protein 6-like [Schistocerca gregaria]|uniref:tigger transposable element-derived protein 6-like n=1 Tax=Schistocerca gregaria TaxID=7010 RepID=UPI00211F22A7|nr:tigger transposable element-derived protein 6-like [Schistocerca gregaria]